MAKDSQLLIVLPVCPCDAHLAKFNLDLLRHFGEHSIPLDVLITTDDSFDPSGISASAKDLFASVKTYRYPRSWNGPPPPWPWPQNWAWQQSAKELERRYGPVSGKKSPYSHWFWWEADCVPLKPGAFQALAEAVKSLKKPFAGWIERTNWTHRAQYMAGPGLYPLNISKHVDRALLAKKSPFDVVAGIEDGLVANNKIEDFSHLIQHSWREDNKGDSFGSQTDLDRLARPEVYFYHRSEDGSLQFLLSDGKTGTRLTPSAYQRYLPGQIFNLQQTQDLCRQHLTSPHLPAPPLSAQLEWPGGLIDFPLQPGDIYFNCGLVQQGSSTFLIARHTHNNINSLVVWDFKLEDCTVSDPRRIAAPNHSEHYEDPRAIWWGERDRFVLSVCNYDLSRHHFAHQTQLDCSPQWSVSGIHHIVYGRNGGALHTNSGHEKNWLPWLHEGRLYLTYSLQPHVIIELSNSFQKQRVFSTAHPKCSWLWGELRGGSPPIRVGNEYIIFLHSSIPWRVISGATKRRYVTGACAFSAEPPFRITRLTQAPFLTGSEQDPLLAWSPLVSFVCGAILNGPDFLLVGGCNDACCFWQKIPMEIVQDQLKPL